MKEGMKHTPGPWTYESGENYPRIFAGRKVIAQAIGNSEETEANVYLIAAAPDLLKALKLARAYLGKAVADGLMQNCARPPQHALSVVEAAIAKTGEQP